MNTDIRHDNSNERRVNAENPWPGLASFTEYDREFFYGREEEKDDLFRRVVRQSLTILFGQSGLGKSSLLRAGLFPKLREAGYLPVPIRLDHSPNQLSLAAQVILAADQAIASVDGKVEGLGSETPDSLWKYFHRRNFVPTDPQGVPLRLILVFDQFEELFAAGQANEAARRRASDFINQFADLIENRVPLALEEQMDSQPELARLYDMQEQDHRYLICMREDYLPQLESLKRVIPSLSENRMRLTRMNGINALEAVLSPGRNLLTEDVATRIVRFVSGGKVRQLDGSILHDHDVLAGLEIEPSLLSLVCRELNSQRQTTGLSQITIDLLAGNQKRILFDFYERCVADMPAALRGFIEDELVTESGLRENVALERIQSYLKEQHVDPSSVDELIRRRLLQVEERLDVRRIELTHDVLTSVVKQSRDERRAREATLRAEQEAAQLLARARQQRRRLSLIVGGMAVILGIVSIFAISVFNLYQISQERLLEVESQKRRAEDGEKEAAQAKVKAEAVKDVFDEATLPVTVENAPHIPGLGPVQEELAQLRIKSLQRLAAKTPDDQTIPAELAEAFAVSGVIRTYVGSFEAAKSDLNKAIELYRQLRAKSPQSLELKRLELQTRSDLGFLFKEDGRNEAAREAFQSIIRELEEELKNHPEDVAFQFELLLALCRQTGTYPPQMPLVEKKQNVDRMAELLDSLDQKKYRPGDVIRLRTVMLYHQNLLDSADLSFEQRLSRIDKLKELDDAALDYFPRSPMIRSYRNFSLNDRADLMAEQSLTEQGINDRQLALAEARSIYQSSPNVYRYATNLNRTLLYLADDFSRGSEQRSAEAEKLLLESTKLTEELKERFPDRGFVAEEWIKQKIRHANWLKVEEYQNNKIRDKQGFDKLVLQSIEPSRALADKFTDHYGTQIEFAALLGMAGSIQNDTKNHQQAFDLYLEAMEVMANRCFVNNAQDIQEADIVNFLDYAGSAAEAALVFQGDEELAKLLDTLETQKISFNNRTAIFNYGRALHAAALRKFQEQNYTEVVRWTTMNSELQKKALLESPWHWFLRNDLGKSYRLLGDAALALEQPQEAIRAYREFAQVILAPLHSADITEFLNEAQPSTQEYATTLKNKIDTLLNGSMKRFTVEAVFDGKSYPIPIYITNVSLPKHPLEDQAKWLKEERNGIIPEETMDQYKRLQEIAAENKVSFVELCMYAIGDMRTIQPEGFGEELPFDDGQLTVLDNPAGKPIDVEEAEVITPTRSVFAKEFAQIEELRATLREYPDDWIVLNLLLSHVDQLGKQLVEVDMWEDAAGVLEYANSLHSINLEISAFDSLKAKNFAKSLRLLAVAYFNQKDFEATLVTMQRHNQLLKQTLKLTTNKSQIEADLAESCLILGEICERTQTSTEAMSWYLQAAELKHPRAFRKISRLLRFNPSLATLLAEPEQDLFNELFMELPDSAQNRLEFYTKELKEVRLNELLGTDLPDSSSQAENEKTWYESLYSHERESIERFITEFDRRMSKLRDDPEARRRREALIRGREKYSNQDYAGALPDYVEACQDDDTTASDLNRLGTLFGKNGKWDESIEAYKRAIEKHNFSALATSSALNLFEAFVCNNQPEKLITYNEELTAKGFEIPAYDDRELAIYHAFIAIAKVQMGEDPQSSLDKSREFRERMLTWTSTRDWAEFDNWLNKSDLNEEKKNRIRSIVDEIRPKDLTEKKP